MLTKKRTRSFSRRSCSIRRSKFIVEAHKIRLNKIYFVSRIIVIRVEDMK